MNYYQLTWKFISRKEVSGRRSWTIFVPILGVMLGTLVVSLTFAIMDGMESEIFLKLRNFPAPARIQLTESGNDDLLSVREFLKGQDVDSYRMLERKAILSHGEHFRIITLRAIDPFPNYINNLPSKAAIGNSADSDGLFLGRELASRLNLIKGSEVYLISPLDVSLVTGTPPRVSVEVAGEFEMELVDMDLNFGYIPFDTGRKLFKNALRASLILMDELSVIQLSELENKFPNLEYRIWQDDYGDLVSAMKLEKVAYTTFGFMIVAISSFNLLSIMMMTVMRKIPQIGILRTIGYSSKNISWVFLVQSLITGITGGFLGIFGAVAIVRAEAKWHFVHHLFGSFPMMTFPLILSIPKLFIVFGISLILVILAGVYPAWKAAHLAPIDAIDYVK